MPLNSAAQVPIYGSALQRSEWRNMFYWLSIPMALQSMAAPENGPHLCPELLSGARERRVSAAAPAGRLNAFACS
jgi:hypothetical protein